MNEKLKKFKYVQYLANVILGGFETAYVGFIAIKLSNQIHKIGFLYVYLYFVVALVLFCLLYYIVYFASIIIHELGHLIFGLKAKLSFVSFNVYKYTFYIADNKLNFKKDTVIPDVLGYCNMSFDKGKKYSKKSMILYFMGGIIFNLILVFISYFFLFNC